MFSIVTQVHRVNVTAAAHWAVIEHYVSLNRDENLKFDSSVARVFVPSSKTDDKAPNVPAAAHCPPSAFSPPGEVILDQAAVGVASNAIPRC